MELSFCAQISWEKDSQHPKFLCKSAVNYFYFYFLFIFLFIFIQSARNALGTTYVKCVWQNFEFLRLEIQPQPGYGLGYVMLM